MRRNRLISLLANLLIALGLLLLIGVAGVYAYSYYLDEQSRADPWLSDLEGTWRAHGVAAPSPTGTAGPEETPTAGATATARASATSVGEEAGGAAPPACAGGAADAPGCPAEAVPAAGIVIPSIGVNSRVVEVGIKDGAYQVPKFYVGHMEGTAYPGQAGNGVYSGHVESISSGNVFAKLAQMKPGDVISLYTTAGVRDYAVVQTEVVRYDAVSVLAPTPMERITLITWTGDWDPSLKQYTERFVVIAEPRNGDGPSG
ncbi:MAG: sortase [Dehalococcoidales bacterium]|nr:sortase [Dehalococcoidales bacterium]